MPSPFFFQNILTKKPKFNKYSFLFDGVNELININGVRTSLATTTVGTFTCWFKPLAISDVILISFCDTDADSFIFINPYTDSLIYCTCRNATTNQWQVKTTNAAISNGVWVHIGLVQDGISPVIYVNGTAVAQSFTVSTDKTTWFNNIAGLDNGRIGDRNFNSRGEELFVNGNIDEVGFWNTNLSAAQILEVYNSGNPKNLLVHSANANLVSYFRMGDGDTFGGTNWTLYDKKGTNNGTSANMESGDLSVVVP